MRIGITGVTGFIGRALALEASRRGFEVVGFSRKLAVEVAGVSEMRRLDEGGVLVVEGLDALVHLAGESVFGYWSEGKKRRIRDSRVWLTQWVVRGLRQAAEVGRGVPVLLCGSGAGVYGDRGDEELTEQAEMGEGFLVEVCRDWEAAAMEAEGFGTRVVCLRTGMVLGDGGGGWPMLRRVFRGCLGSVLGSGRQWVPWIHLADEVGLILHALEEERCRGVMNLAAPGVVRNVDFTRAIAKRVGRPVMPRVPEWVLRVVMGEMSEMVLSSQRVKPALALETGYEFKFLRLEEALGVLRG